MSRLFIKKEKKISKSQKNLGSNDKNAPFSPKNANKIEAEYKNTLPQKLKLILFFRILYPVYHKPIFYKVKVAVLICIQLIFSRL